MIVWDNFFWFTSYILVFTALSAFGAHRIKVLYHFWKHRKDVPTPQHEFAELPVITVQLPIFNELHVVENLLRTVSALDYPRDRLQIQVLDDSTDETAAHAAKLSADLKAQGYDVEYRHRTNRHGFKAGALDEGMATAKGEFICIFDADFQPQPDYLKKVIHHFSDEKVGMVQARWGHLNKNFSLLTRLQALFLDGHLVLEQTARSRHGEFLNFNGTAGIWRRKAIEDGGGWQHDTLTEDLDLSYRTQLKGWKFIYLKDVVVPAELPPDMDGFKSQQHRWTKGSIQVCKKILGDVWRSDIPLRLKAGGHRASHLQFRLPAHALHAGAHVSGELRDGQLLAQGGVRRCAGVLLRLAERRGVLHDRAGCAGPLRLAQGPALRADAARARHRHEHQQRQGRAGGAAQPVLRLHPHAEIRCRKQGAGSETASALQGRQVDRVVDRGRAHRLLRLDDRPRRATRPVGLHSLPAAVLLRLRLRGLRLADETLLDVRAAGTGGGLAP
jgi:hypothetical protein